MSDLPVPPGQLEDALASALIAAPAGSHPALLATQGWTPDTLVRALAARSLSLLDVDANQALQIAELADALAAQAGNTATAARAHRAMAHALRVCGQHAAALQRYDAAHAGFAQCGEAVDAARSLIGKITALMYLGRYDEAAQTAEQARTALLALGEYRSAARVDDNLGNVFHRSDRHDQALEAYERAQVALRLHGDALDLAINAHNRGNVLAMLNRFDEALDAYAAAEEIFRAHSRHAQAAQTAYNKAYLYFLRSQYGQALAELAHARALFQQPAPDRQHLALCDLDEAEILLALNRRPDAAELARRAAAAFDRLAMRYEAGKARVFSAIVALEEERVAEAELELGAAGALFAQEGNQAWQAVILLLRANLQVRRDQAASALALCDQALALLDPVAFAGRVGRGRVLRAQALCALGRQEQAQADVEAACHTAAALGDRVLSYQAFHLLGRLQTGAGDLEAAAASYLRAADDVDWLRGGITRDELRISFAHDKVALYEDIVHNCLQRGRVGEAFEQAERARARALAELLAGGSAIRPHADMPDAQLATRLEALRAELTGLYNRLHGEGEERQRSAERSATLLARIRRYEDEMTSTLSALSMRHDGYVTLRTAGVAELAQIRSHLATDDALIAYYLLGDAVMAFVVTEDDVRVYGPLATRREIEELLARWRFHLTHFTYGPAFVARHDASMWQTALDILGALYRRLIAPLSAGLEGRSLIIVPHGALHHLPFHALHDGRGFMIERHAIAYAPSATALVMHRPLRTAPAGPLIVGMPSPALPHIAEEVAAVAACHPQCRVLLGDEATRERVTAAASDSILIHLATHGIFRGDNPLYSAVQLADDWLTATDIFNLRLRADLVVLSACDSGASDVLRGDELIGLTRGLLYAGARTLVVSLWAAHDAATAALMRAFYRGVTAGTSVRRALQAAQREIMAHHPHPYFWAPFVMVGPAEVRTGRAVAPPLPVAG